MSHYTKVQAAFAGQHNLMPHADERVQKFELLGDDTILVAYVGRDKKRMITAEKVCGAWVLADVLERKVTVKPPAKVSISRKVAAQRAKLNRIARDPEFHLIPGTFTAQANLRRPRRKGHKVTVAGRKINLKARRSGRITK